MFSVGNGYRRGARGGVGANDFRSRLRHSHRGTVRSSGPVHLVYISEEDPKEDSKEEPEEGWVQPVFLGLHRVIARVLSW